MTRLAKELLEMGGVTMFDADYRITSKGVNIYSENGKTADVNTTIEEITWLWRRAYEM